MRRTRIKGIANIPQRKKAEPPDKTDGEIKNQQEVSKSVNGLEQENSKTHQLSSISDTLGTGKTILNEITQKVRKSDSDNVDIHPSNSVSKINEPLTTVKRENISILGNVLLQVETQIFNSNSAEIQEDSAVIGCPVISDKNDCNEFEKKPISFRRRAIKPNISAQALNRKSDIKTSIDNENVDMKKTTSFTDSSEDRVEKFVNEIKLSDQKIENTASFGDIIPQSNCSYSSSQVISAELKNVSQLKSPTHNTLDVIKTSIQHANVGSDCEYPPPPSSPNKLNRSRIKAIPKIGNRKISFSASESEDESKKHEHRVRHDSQSSNFSTAHESVSDQPSTLKMMEFSSVIQRKCKRTDWSRKLADARREFTRKFVSGKPDHKKLTMIDLIFYNPTTNVMKNEKKSISETDSKLNSKNEEDVDNPLGVGDDPTNNDAEDSKKSDEENEVPAPQIRIGPSGEIIIDEKSLVIENKQTIINREQLQRSQVIDGNGDRPYGVYKKVKRSKDWTHSETLRFYKALSTIGTDFTLMCELFPNRTRRELKMKFKKEEKINQTLVDKAVMEPCSFDFEELKKEFELVEIERKELEKQRIEEQKLKKTKGIKKSIKLLKFTEQNDKHQMQTTNSVRVESDVSDGESPSEIQKNSSVNNGLTNATKLRKKRNKSKIPHYMKKDKQNNFDIMSVLTNSDSSNSGSEDLEVAWKPVLTRYGRKTRKRQIYEPEANIQEEIIVPRKISKPNLGTDEEQQKPGSLMMISSKAPDGQPVVQIFMVTDKKVQNGKNIQGIEDVNTENLLPIAMIKTGQTDDEGEEMIENNYTIPAEPENQNSTQVVDIVESIDDKIKDSMQT
ncbi:hypothetical protein WA026_011713 [Henosepilachna vigintioctopunctata]|uniref:Myb-like domain-containing protein n=1 Tax=Henosepilachna vigintioctopunctata TaxID=420089 RepID=A0AAW1UH00_9CUCU